MSSKGKTGQKNPNAQRISKWYKADDQPLHFRRKNRAPRPTRLRRNITPGTILVVLSGRFRGKRVVFLKQLKSGLLLVTGPYKINGVPLRRVNQAYVIPTSTKVPLDGVNVTAIEDAYFAKSKVRQVKKSEDAFFTTSPEKSEEEKKRLAEKKKTQADVDKALIANVKKVELLKNYLSARFTITNRMRPHELVF